MGTQRIRKGIAADVIADSDWFVWRWELRGTYRRQR